MLNYLNLFVPSIVVNVWNALNSVNVSNVSKTFKLFKCFECFSCFASNSLLNIIFTIVEGGHICIFCKPKNEVAGPCLGLLLILCLAWCIILIFPYFTILTISSWWSSDAPWLIKSLTMSRCPPAAALCRAVCPV